MLSKEQYRPEPLAANASFRNGGTHVAGFLGVTAGTITITAADGTVLLAAMPVVTGFNRIAMLFPTSAGGTISLGGGASGTLLL